MSRERSRSWVALRVSAGTNVTPSLRPSRFSRSGLRLAPFFLLLSLFSPLNAADLRVVGSDLLGIEFSKGLYAFAGPERLPLSIAFDGSRPALERLKSGRADLAILLLPESETESLASFISLIVGYQRILVFVPAAYPLEQLSLDQLARVFDGGITGRPMRWSELGIAGELGAGNIAPLAPEPGGALTTELFRRLVLQGRPCAGERYPTPEAFAAHFRHESRVLALAGVAPRIGVRARLLAIATRTGEPAFLPTPENLHTGDYPLRLAVRLVVRPEAKATARHLLRFLAGEASAPLWESAAITPLPSTARGQNERELGRD